ncbi:MAG TPA: acetyl-CoA carboxylase biotin carboxyl carrier protein [Lachnospiraceae bacterium]|nr:acetyl-CoA carboxylase biotin carboxyl carrier protein [Lachnospiraceae bacterium]
MQFEELKELIAIFEKSDMNDMKVHFDNASIHLSRGKCQTVPVNMHKSVLEAEKTSPPDRAGLLVEEEKKESEGNVNTTDGKYIKAPIVGTFYQAASPEKPPYVNVGDKVKKGDIVCIIEAMKFMNEITSEEDGEILEVLVKDGEFVEFGAPLFRFK